MDYIFIMNNYMRFVTFCLKSRYTKPPIWCMTGMSMIGHVGPASPIINLFNLSATDIYFVLFRLVLGLILLK